MANTRVFQETQDCTINGVDLAGVTRIETEQSYVQQVTTQDDDGGGIVDADVGGKRVRVTVATSDVLQAIALLLSAPTTGVWLGKESGTATYGQETLKAPLFSSLAFSSGRGQHAAAVLSGQCRFGAGDDFEDIEAWVAGAAAPMLNPPPDKLWLPVSMSHGSLAPLHIDGFNFNVPGEIIEDWDGATIGTEAVDKGDYGLITVSLTIFDSAKDGINAWQIATALMKNAIADLAVVLKGAGGVANKTCTVRNAKWISSKKVTSKGYTGQTISGIAPRRDAAGTIWTIDHATPASRMINFA